MSPHGPTRLGFVRQHLPLPLGEVAEKLSTEDDRARALAVVKSKEFLRIVKIFWIREGIAPHPLVAYRMAIGEDPKVSPRAATPCRRHFSESTRG